MPEKKKNTKDDSKDKEENISPLVAEDDSRGWEGIKDHTGGLDPEEIPELVDIRHLEFIYPLLRSLIGRSPRDFLIRTATLRSIVTFHKAWLLSQEVDDALYWLSKESRESVLRILRIEGWLEFNPSKGTRITPSGQWAYEVLGFLLREAKEDELAPTVESLDHAISLGVPALHYLSSMKNRLLRLMEEIQDARSTYSPVILRRAADKVDTTLTLSERIRTVLRRIDRTDRRSRLETHNIHDLLSRLHTASAQLHKDLVEVGRQYLHLQDGVTHEQIVSYLMKITKKELTSIGSEVLHASYVPPLFLTQEVLLSAAETQMLRERGEPPQILWEEPLEVKREAQASDYPPEVLAFLSDLQSIHTTGTPVALSKVIPNESVTNSFLRASLLPLIGDSKTGGGVAGRLGTLSLHIDIKGDGWPEELDGKVLSKLTPGQITRRE